MRHLWVTGLAILTGVTLLSHPACRPVQVAHYVKDPRWPLRGKHQTLVCEQCHGPLPEGCMGPKAPEAPSTSCIGCHSGDVPPGAPHYPGRECSGCHVEEGWAVGLTEPDTGTPPPEHTAEDTDTTPPEDTAPDHEPVAPGQLCWECHEDERPKPPEHDKHWVDLPRMGDRWDCGPCHTLRDWLEITPYVDARHPVHMPHGMWHNQNPTPRDRWVTTCTPCHTTSEPYSEFQCIDACHDDVQFVPPADHNSFQAGEDQRDCLGCHQYGDYWRPM